jgi:hypothetical protein
LRAPGLVRFSVLVMSLAGTLLNAANCYRAEVDLGPFVDGPPPGGGTSSGGVPVTTEMGQGGSHGAVGGGADGGADGQSGGGADGQSGGGFGAGAGEAAGAPKCDPTPEDPEQNPCRERRPSKQSCDEQDIDGWNGCYAGGCSICTQSLIDYPYYFDRHRCCEPNPTCSTHPPYRCSPLCPPPTELDKRPLCFNLER